MREQAYGIDKNILIMQSAAAGFFARGNVIFQLNFCL